MTGLALLLALVAAAIPLPIPQSGVDAADAEGIGALLDRGRYVEALVSIDELEGAARHRWRLRALHQAGDLLAALDAAELGLKEAPSDPELLLGGADVALVLGAPVATELCERFGAAVDALPPETEHRSWWQDRATTYRALAAIQEEARDDRRRAEERARWIAGLGFAAAAAWLIALALRRVG